MKNLSRRYERGIALLAAMFLLLLLSVVGLGMMYSTNTETAINANFRDKQVAIYASLAGLQEARDRIQPATANIVAPLDLPSMAESNVIYIINPRGGETVAPWDINNEYADTELCQENVLGLSGTAGTPCTTLPNPADPDWYEDTVVDNSGGGVWNFASPLDMKWTRITVKGNNMTPVPVNGNSADSSIVCWDGATQRSVPGGYGTDCAPNGSVATIDLTNPGAGYSSTPLVTVEAPPMGGTQATATAVTTSISNGEVASVTLSDPGSSYTSAPTVTISGGGGSGATATATIIQPGSPVASLSLTTGTKCYATPPGIAITGGGGSGAAATAVLASTPSCIAAWTVSGSCSARKNTTLSGIGLDGATGSGFSGTIQFSNGQGNAQNPTIQNPGSSYTSNPTTINWPSNPSCPGVTFTPSLGYALQSLTLTSGGSGYSTAPSVSIGAGVGTSATAPTSTATLGAPPANVGEVVSITVTSPGSNYTSVPTVTISGGGGAGATATADLGVTYTVTDVVINNPGAGYTSDPGVTISGGGGAGAAAVATIGRGPNYGQVYLITSLAATRSGARAMSQMEVATPVAGFNVTGALTLAGPSPVLTSMPNSNNYQIVGADANSCMETSEIDHPAIGGWDDPNADPPTESVETIIDALPRPDHYTGAGGTPSVQNVFGSLGETMGTPVGLKALIDAIKAAPGANVYGDDPGSIEEGDANNPEVNYVEGDLDFGGDGFGILVVTGTARFNGNFGWHGIVLVVGDGVADFDGGGNGLITGTVIVSRIWDNQTDQNLLDALGSPTMDWNGGGGNGIHYDHCWAENLMNEIPFDPPPTTRPLKILSIRTLPY